MGMAIQRLGYRCRFGCWLLSAAGILLLLLQIPLRLIRHDDRQGRSASAAASLRVSSAWHWDATSGSAARLSVISRRAEVMTTQQITAHRARHHHYDHNAAEFSSPASTLGNTASAAAADKWPLRHSMTTTAGSHRLVITPKATPAAAGHHHCRLQQGRDKLDASSNHVKSISHEDFFESYEDVSRHEAMDYEIINIVGRGAYGTVVDAIDVHTGELVAIKKMWGLSESGRGWKNLQELKFLRLLGESDNIISVKRILLPVTSGNQTFNTAFLVMEKMDNAVKSMHAANPQTGLFALRQILRGLHYMHSAGVSHRDLKGENIVMNDNCKFKLIDFGISAPVCRGELVPSPTDGMARNHPPEMLMAEMTNWTHAMDVWGLGLVFVRMSTGKSLFSRINGPRQAMISIIQQLGTPPPHVLAKYPERLQDFIKTVPYHPPRSLSDSFPTMDKASLRLATAMLDLDPETRPTTGQLLSDPIFAYLERGRPLPTRSVISQADLGIPPKLTELRMAYYEEALLHYQKSPPKAQAKGVLLDLQDFFSDFQWTLRARMSSFARMLHRTLAL